VEEHILQSNEMLANCRCKSHVVHWLEQYIYGTTLVCTWQLRYYHSQWSNLLRQVHTGNMPDV